MGVYIGKSARRSLSAETRWRDCEEAPAAQAGPKRREALAPEARHWEKRKALAQRRNALEGLRGGSCRTSRTEASRGASA
jgi:hypothetical protein